MLQNCFFQRDRNIIFTASIHLYVIPKHRHNQVMAEKKIKLLSVGHSYVVALNRSLMRELNRRGRIEVTVASPRFFAGDLRPIDLEAEPTGSHLEVIPLDCYLSRHIHVFIYHPRQLKKLLQSRQWDYGYLWEEPYIYSGYQLGKAFRHEHVPYSLFTNQNIFKKYPWPFSYFEKQTLHHCDSLWGCGPQILETFRQKDFRGNAEILPYFVNTDRFRPLDAETKKQHRQKFGLQNVKTVGFMGRLTEEKGLRIFLNAVEQLPAQQAWQVLILGDGPLREEIQKWVVQKKMQNRFFLKLMKHEEIPQILPTMDLLLCPSQTMPFWREQFGRMIIEGFACGVPVMASDSGEIPFVVGEAGIVLPEKDQALWTQTLLQTLFSDEKLQALRQRGFQRAQMFSINSVAQKIEEMILARTAGIK